MVEKKNTLEQKAKEAKDKQDQIALGNFYNVYWRCSRDHLKKNFKRKTKRNRRH